MSWVQDLHFALRMMRKQPWFTFAIIATLSLGIGVNTTVFTLVNAVLLKPLPFAGGDRLVLLRGMDRAHGRDSMSISVPDYHDLKSMAKSFESLEAFSWDMIALSEKGATPERYHGALVSAGMFTMLHTPPALGSGLEAADERPGAAQKILIGYGVWKDRYGKDPSVIGRVVRVNEKPATIAGVMPEGFRFPNQEDLWLALAPDATWEKRTERRLMPIGILKEGVSLAEARAEASVLSDRLQKAYPQTNKDITFGVRTFHEAFSGGPIRQMFLLLQGAVGFVLLIACANVANMLLSRAAGREREMSIRSALGAGRWRIMRQVLLESVVMAVMGGLIGLLLAQWGVAAFAAAVSAVGKPYWIDFKFNYLDFAYFGVICLTAGILFGMFPALQVSRHALFESLKEGSRSSGSKQSGRVSAVLVVMQFSLAVVLLVGAGLLMRSFLEHQNVSRGLSSGNLLHAALNLPSSRYKAGEDRRRFYERLLTRLKTLPGAEAVAFTSNAPGNGGAGWLVDIEGRPLGEGEKRPAVTGLIVTPGYFTTLGRPLQRGRDFTETDGLPGKERAIVSRKMVARFWPAGEALGQRVRIYREGQPTGPWLTIVGVAPDLVQDFQQVDPAPLLFVPHRQDPSAWMSIILRSSIANAAAFGSPIRQQVQALDEDLPVSRVMPMEELLQQQRWHWRVFGTLFLVFAGIAAMMSAVGIYAVLAQSTARRTREIGVRLALGARTGDVLRLVMKRGIAQVGIALSLGLAAAFGVCRLMQGLLFGVTPADPLTFVIVAVFLTAAGLLACWLPARRAAGLDPMRALRDE